MASLEEELPTAKGAAYRFANLTGMHGVPNISVARSLFRRIIWIILTLVMSGVTLWQLTEAVQKLISHPVSTAISFTYTSPTNFPAVTICNLNPVKYETLAKYNSDPYVQKLLSTVGGQNLGPIAFSSTNTSGTSWNSRDQSNTRQDSVSSSQVFRALSSVPSAIANNISYSIDNVLIDCSFGGKNCVPNDFITFRTTRYGNCFIFNSGLYNNKTTRPVKEIAKTGSEYGLKLTLYVDQNNYIPNVIPNAGYKVLIKNYNDPPLPESNGYEVAPGFQTTFGVRTVISERATSPYGTCLNFTKTQNASMNHMIDQLPQTIPSTEVCLQVCEQLLIIQQCQCNSYHNGLITASPYNNVNKVIAQRPCDVEDRSADAKCIATVSKNSSSYCKANYCKYQECIIVGYKAMPSASAWPAEYAYADLVNSVKQHPDRSILKNLENKTSEQMRTFISRNFVKIGIFFENLDIEYILTEGSYLPITFIGDLGGITGLWLGFSILTFFELIEFVIDLFISLWYCKQVAEVGDKVNDSSPSVGYTDDGIPAYMTEFSRPSRREAVSKIV